MALCRRRGIRLGQGPASRLRNYRQVRRFSPGVVAASRNSAGPWPCRAIGRSTSPRYRSRQRSSAALSLAITNREAWIVWRPHRESPALTFLFGVSYDLVRFLSVLLHLRLLAKRAFVFVRRGPRPPAIQDAPAFSRRVSQRGRLFSRWHLQIFRRVA